MFECLVWVSLILLVKVADVSCSAVSCLHCPRILQLSDEVEGKETKFFCDKLQSCSTLDGLSVLSRTSSKTSSGLQHRWYIKRLNENGSWYRYRGAIELSSEPLSWGPWKEKLNETSEFVLAPHLFMSVWSPECESEDLHSLVASLWLMNSHRHFRPDAASLWASYTQQCHRRFQLLLSNFDTESPLLSLVLELLRIDQLIQAKQYVRAVRDITSLRIPHQVRSSDIRQQVSSQLRSTGDLLIMELVTNIIKFVVLVAQPVDMRILSLLSDVRSHLSSNSRESAYYQGQIEQIQSILHILQPDPCSGMQISSKFIFSAHSAIQSMDSYITNNLDQWNLASEYWMKLKTGFLLLLRYMERGDDVADVLASTAQYSIISGAVHHASGLLASAVTLGRTIMHSSETCDAVESSQIATYMHMYNSTSSSYVESARQLQHVLTAHPARLDRIFPFSDLFQNFLTVFTQIVSPVILSASLEWEAEVIELRRIAVSTLRSVMTTCVELREQDGCHLNVHHLGAGVRGLFLAAYQGVSLLQDEDEYSNDDDDINDTVLPQMYYQLIKSASDEHSVVSHTIDDVDDMREQSGDIVSHDSTSHHPISVVVVCYSLSRHSVGRLLAKLLQHMVLLKDPDTGDAVFDLYFVSDKQHPAVAVSANTNDDDIFASLVSQIPASHWITIAPYDFSKAGFYNSVKNLLQQLPSGEMMFDIALNSDLLMQSSLCIWASQLRLARYQVLFWGHPQTSGMDESIDYFLTADDFEPVSARFSRQTRQFSEQLVRFDTLSFVLSEPEVHANALTQSISKSRSDVRRWIMQHGEGIWARNSEPLTLDSQACDCVYQHSSINNNITSATCIQQCMSKLRLYGCMQTLMKHHPLLDRLFGKLLLADSSAVIVLLRPKADKQSHWFLQYQVRLYSTVLSMVNGSEQRAQQLLQRVVWISSLPHKQYAEVVCAMDVMLDPVVFGGGVTLCDGVAGGCVDGPVGFVTAGALQTVHRIGSGIARVLNDSSIAVDVTADMDRVSSKDFSHILDKYVSAAVTLATVKMQRADDAMDAEQMKQVTDRAHKLVHGNEVVFEEWVRFFRRLRSSIY